MDVPIANSGINLFKDQPKGLFYLFFAEMWERFSFYGLRALLVLYMTSELRFTDKKAYGVYAAYFTLVYLATIVGGLIADRYLGNRKSIIAGAVLITLGHFSLSFSGIDSFFFYFGLGFIVGGTGLFKANISTLVGQLYEKEDQRRDSGFTLFYIGINFGGLLAPLVCGIIGEVYGWHYGFGIASIGMLAGLVTFLRGCKHMDDKGLPEDPQKLNKMVLPKINVERFIYLVSLLSVPLLSMVLIQYHWFESALPVIGVIFGAYSLYLIASHQGEERRALVTIFTLMFFQTAFFSIFEQAGSSMNLFTERNVDRMFWGYEISASAFQSLNSFFIIILGSLFAGLWSALGRRKCDPSPATKFALALLQVGLGFLALYWGAVTADSSGMTSMLWLVLAYFLHTTGELCIMPVGLSMVTRISPQKILSTIMGLWFVSLAFSEYLAGVFSKFASVEGGGENLDPTQTIMVYGEAFGIGAKFAFLMALILICIVPILNKNFKKQTNFAVQNEQEQSV
ncbi:MAG: peptide MFS transporter [Oligoflexales bacterium]|nr:peptide MFS transporter [Oligoflexales bacterium]